MLLLIASHVNIFPILEPLIKGVDHSLVTDQIVDCLRLVQISPHIVILNTWVRLWLRAFLLGLNFSDLLDNCDTLSQIEVGHISLATDEIFELLLC